MNKIILKIILFMLSMSVSVSAQVNSFNELYKLYDDKDYFRFINNLYHSEINGWERTVLNSFALSISNKNKQSNDSIETLLGSYKENIKDSLKLGLYETMVQNSLVMHEYSKALKYAEIIMKDYKSLLDSNDIEEYENVSLILNAAKDLGIQTAAIKGDSRIKIRRDMAGMTNIPLKINGNEEEFIFDTGANISTIKKSLAKKLKLIFLKGNIKVGSMTGIKVDSELAYAESLEIGNITYKNVLFLVVPDDVLTFAGGLYSIDGIIGYPVFREMREIQLSDNELFIPQNPAPKQGQNLVMNGFNPVVNAVINNDSLAFTFDTGARTTVLYYKYYEKYKKEIDKKYEMEDVEIGGAGGSVTVKGFKLDNISVNIAGSKARIEDIKLISENVKNTDKYFYGNLGQDYFKQFNVLIINLESMYVEFRK
jgi:predicted aspartyl protease